VASAKNAARPKAAPIAEPIAIESIAAPPVEAHTPVPPVKRARQRLDAGDAAGARDLARDAVRSAPDRAAGYIVLAAALDKLGDRAGKAAAFRSCAQLATDSLAASCKALARERLYWFALG
jgi:Flp pilus assembly protein TadD